MSDKKPSGIDLIAAERYRQVAKGYTPEVDSKLPDGSLSMAAICYAMDEQLFMKTEQPNGVLYSDPWPWDSKFDHRRKIEGVVVYKLSLKERINQLVKAGALIAAELDSLQFKDEVPSLEVSPKKSLRTYFAEPDDDDDAVARTEREAMRALGKKSTS